MARHAAARWCICAVFLSAGCASGPDEAPKPDDANELALSIPKAPERPEYHAESDAVSFATRESSKLTAAICAQVDDRTACQKRADRRLRGYRGSFSQAGADETLIALSDTAVLMDKTSGRWKALARLEGVDIDQCLLAAPVSDEAVGDGAGEALLCRAASAEDAGFGLSFFRLSVDENGELATRHLDAPRTTDVDTSLFAGWKSEGDRIEVRFHKETAVKSASELDFGGSEICRYRTFGYEQAPQPALVELDGCPGESEKVSADSLAPAHATRKSGQYENRLDRPIRAHNREYVMCYHHELERLKQVAEADQAKDKDKDKDKKDEASEAEGVDEKDEPIAGDIHVRFVIGSSGAPVSCEVAQSTMQNDNVHSCLCREIMKTAFPPVPSGKFVDVTYPFRFAPAAD